MGFVIPIEMFANVTIAFQVFPHHHLSPHLSHFSHCFFFFLFLFLFFFFSGDNCEIAPSFCSVDSTFGNPFLWQEYWMNYGHSMIEAPTFRSPYFFLGAGPFDSVGIMNVLVPQIKRLHEMYQNAETEGRTIVFGNGGTHLINAVNYAYAEVSFFLSFFFFEWKLFFFIIHKKKKIVGWETNDLVCEIALLSRVS